MKPIKLEMKIAIIAIVLAFGIFFTVSTLHLSLSGERQNNPETVIDVTIPFGTLSSDQMGSTGIVKIHAAEPATPSSLPVYKAVLTDNDVVSKEFEDLFNSRRNVTAEQDAPNLAKKALEPYGGLPADAVLRLSETVYGESINRTTHKTESSTPIFTQVFYKRVVDGMPVIGYADKIQICFGEDGKVLRILKIWRTIEKTESRMTIIPARSATGKLMKGEVLDRRKSVGNVSVNSIRLEYYETSRSEKEITLEPVWAFDGYTSSGSPEEFLVYARQFAGFTQGPTATTKSVAGKTASQTDPPTVTFTDTSDAGPTKWLWDFGDGTTSSERNPVHTYKSAGTYNVSLTVWNDMGSDTIVQQCVVEGEAVKTTVTTIPGTTGTVPTTTRTTIPATTIVTNTRTVSTTATLAVNQTSTPVSTISPVPTTSVLSIPVNETATASPVPTTVVTISPTSSPGITGNTTSGNTTAG